MTNGTLEWDASGLYFTYTPSTGFSGDDTFQYKFTQTGGVQSTTGTVTIHVLLLLPEGADDSFEVDGEAEISAASVLANDTWASGVALASQPANGTVTFDGTAFHYTASQGFEGNDSFQYRAINASGQSAPVTVSLQVVGPGTIAQGDDFWTDAGSFNACGNVMDNDPLAASVALVNSSSAGLTLDSDGLFCLFSYSGIYDDEWFQYIATNAATGIQSNPIWVNIYVTPYDPQTLGRPAITSNDPALVMSQLLPIRDEAIRRWRAAGVLDAALARQIYNVQFVITDLPGSHIGGSTRDGKILLDKNAAGYGWFVDNSPLDDAEFQHRTGLSEFRADEGDAFDHADLLSVVMHEMGNLLGLNDLADIGSGNVMTWLIDLGVRPVPTQADSLLVNFLYLYPQPGRRRFLGSVRPRARHADTFGSGRDGVGWRPPCYAGWD